jgi:small-conductance mechanosensitive channel
MPQRIYPIGTPINPILQFIYFLLGAVLLIGAILMGAVILAIALAGAVIIGVIVWIRIWWFKRKLPPQAQSDAADKDTSGAADVLEVEYTVIEERDDTR